MCEGEVGAGCIALKPKSLTVRVNDVDSMKARNLLLLCLSPSSRAHSSRPIRERVRTKRDHKVHEERSV